MFSGLSQLQTLDFSINHLNTNLISILSSLSVTFTELDISINQISTLPQNFSTLLPIGLKSLSVGGNCFIPPVLTPEFMQYFPFRLTTLRLESSPIVNITEDSFSNFSALTTLDLSNNQISVLNKSVFSGLSQLITLDLGGNQISVLSKGMLNELSQLTNLNLGYNQISVLNGSVFNGLSQLRTLSLNFNQISILSENVFSGLNQLNTSTLWGNQLSTLSKGAMSGLNQLTALSLLGNEISILDEDVFSGLSQLTYLNLAVNQISILRNSVLSRLNKLTTLYLYTNQISVLSEGILSGLSKLTNLNLVGNQLNDAAIQNLTQNFPYQLNILDVSRNQIGNDGALALAKILPCTNLTSIDFSGNPANDTTLALAAQQKALKKVCDDQRCHANLPATESCGVNTNSSTTGQMIWGLFGSVNEVDETEPDSFDYFDWSHPVKTPSFQPALALPKTTSESSSLLLTTKTAGAFILGMAGLSILFYKNSTWMQAIVNTGSRFFQRCWSGGKTEEIKTISPACSSNRRYALFPLLSASSVQQVSTITRTTDLTLH